MDLLRSISSSSVRAHNFDSYGGLLWVGILHVWSLLVLTLSLLLLEILLSKELQALSFLPVAFNFLCFIYSNWSRRDLWYLIKFYNIGSFLPRHSFSFCVFLFRNGSCMIVIHKILKGLELKLKMFFTLGLFLPWLSDKFLWFFQ